MTNMKRTNLEVAGGLILVTVTWWFMRNNTANEVKKARAEKDKEHAEEMQRFEEQRQKENQMYRSIMDYFVNNKGMV